MELLSPVPRYKYRPLENSTTIRVLVLYAASDFSARLVADIVHVDRKDLLRPMNSQDYPECCRFYEAVSYCWGDPIFTCQLALENGTSFLQITPNVDAMLRRMRRPHKSKYLWIDALSLNQADDVEKSHQVQLMGEIYQQAKKVLFWMGEENGQPISALFNYLNFMAKEFPRWMDKSYNDWQAQFMEQYPGALHNYLSRPWFWRRWIVQEAILGVDSTILCGEHKMDWKVFRFAVQRILSIKDYLPEHSPHPTPFPQSSSQLVNADLLRAINQVIALGAAPSKILHRMMEFRAAECSDPRDRIFALFGVVNDIYEPSNPSPNLSNSLGIAFSVDYSKPWNVVYCEFAKACVEAGHGNEILSHAAHFGSLSHADSLRPSWVPDWSSSTRSRTHRTDMTHKTQHEPFASGHSFKIWPDGTLVLQGLLVSLKTGAASARPTLSSTLFYSEFESFLYYTQHTTLDIGKGSLRHFCESLSLLLLHAEMEMGPEFGADNIPAGDRHRSITSYLQHKLDCSEESSGSSSRLGEQYLKSLCQSLESQQLLSSGVFFDEIFLAIYPRDVGSDDFMLKPQSTTRAPLGVPLLCPATSPSTYKLRRCFRIKGSCSALRHAFQVVIPRPTKSRPRDYPDDIQIV